MKTPIIINSSIITIDNTEGDRNLLQYLPWWVKNINQEKHMLSVTEESLRKELLIAVIAFSENREVIAIAGIVNGRNKEEKEMTFNDKKVVEIGSNFVTPSFRNQGIGSKLVSERLQICKEKNWFPVSITTNPAMIRIFSKLNARSMEDDQQYYCLRRELCICHHFSSDCNVCPLQKNGGWVFE